MSSWCDCLRLSDADRRWHRVYGLSSHTLRWFQQIASRDILILHCRTLWPVALCQWPGSASFFDGFRSRLFSRCQLVTALAQFGRLFISSSDDRSMDVYSCVSSAYWWQVTLNAEIRRLTDVVEIEKEEARERNVVELQFCCERRLSDSRRWKHNWCSLWPDPRVQIDQWLGLVDGRGSTYQMTAEQLVCHCRLQLTNRWRPWSLLFRLSAMRSETTALYCN